MPAPDPLFGGCERARPGRRKDIWTWRPTFGRRACCWSTREGGYGISVVRILYGKDKDMTAALGAKRRVVAYVFRYLITGALVVAALGAAHYGWRIYVTSPWTRDGMVRVQVASVAPLISGRIVEVRIADNQHVHKGDVLYVIEKFDFQTALDNAKATISN